MCNIKSWFSSSKKKKKAQTAAEKAKQEAEAAAQRNAAGKTEQETATSALTNKSQDKNITSLRVPLSTAGTGSNVDREKRLGLNLL